MKSIEILAVGLRLLGIYSAIKLLELILQTAALWQEITKSEGMATSLHIVYGIDIGLTFLICFLLINFPVTLAKKLLPKKNENEAIFNGSAADLQVSAFIIMGVFMFFSAVPVLARDMVNIVQLIMHSDQYGAVSISKYVMPVIGPCIEICIGLYLTFKANALYLLIQSIRGFGAK